MSIKIKEYKAPNLKMQRFVVDSCLDERLNSFGGIHELINKSNFILGLGKPGSGKSSLCTGLLGTGVKAGGLKKVFHRVYVFIPPSSRNSMKDDFWNKSIPPNQIYDDLTLESLEEVYDICKSNAEEDMNSLIVLDDVQKNLKQKEVQKLFLNIVNNRRHSRVSIFLLAQNYFSIPKMVRSGLTDLFVFKASKKEMEQIFDECYESHKDKFLDILEHCFKKPHDFLYINTNSQRIFSNWDEIIISNEDI
jgi:hypothetical protein